MEKEAEETLHVLMEGKAVMVNLCWLELSVEEEAVLMVHCYRMREMEKEECYFVLQFENESHLIMTAEEVVGLFPFAMSESWHLYRN